MSRPVCVILHPKDWASGKYKGKFEYVHVSIGGKIPRKRNGVATFDGYADMGTAEGKADLTAAFKKHKPDIFLFWIHGNFGLVDLLPLKAASPKTRFVMWFGNHRNQAPGNVTNVKRVLDMVLLNSKDGNQYKIYRKAGIRHVGTLWDGFNPDSVKFGAEEPKYDAVFGGNSYIPYIGKNHKLDFPGGQIRYDFIMGVAKHFSVSIRTGYPKSWPFETREEIYHPEYTHFLREGKITLNVNHFPLFRKAYTRRTIRSIFAKRCHVTLYIPGMEDDFTNHKDIVWFKTVEEGIDLVRYYLEHDAEREAIAEESYKLACKKFTFKERMHDFEELMVKEKLV